MNIDHFKNKLDAELTLVEKELNELGVRDSRTGAWDAAAGEMDVMSPIAEPNEAGDKIEEYEEHQEEIAPLQARRSEILHALEKIENGKFGTCEVSGELIEEDRLEANPAARTCKAHL